MALCKETATEVAALDPRQYETEVEATVHLCRPRTRRQQSEMQRQRNSLQFVGLLQQSGGRKNREMTLKAEFDGAGLQRGGDRQVPILCHGEEPAA